MSYRNWKHIDFILVSISILIGIFMAYSVGQWISVLGR